MWFIGLNLLIVTILALHRFPGRHLSNKMLRNMWILIPLFLMLCKLVTLPNPIDMSFLEGRSDRADVTATEIGTEARSDPAAVSQSGAPISDKTDLSDRSGVIPAEGYRNVTSGNINKSWAFDPKLILKTLWLSGALVVGGVILRSNLRFIRKLRNDRRYYGSVEGTALKIYLTRCTSSSFLMGRSIYADPALAEEEDKLALAICHETCHYRHGDMVLLPIKYILLTLFWFDPLFWIAARVFDDDCEIYCDEEVLKIVGPGKTQDYGMMLLDAFARGRNENVLKVSAFLSGSGNSSLKRRLTEMRNPKKKKITSMLAAGLILVMATGCSLVDPDKKLEIETPDETTGKITFESVSSKSITGKKVPRTSRASEAKAADSETEAVQSFFYEHHYEIKDEDRDYIMYNGYAYTQVDLRNPEEEKKSALDYMIFDKDKLEVEGL